jgi:hypothetical protein
VARDLIPPPSPAGRPAPDEPSPLSAAAARAAEPHVPATAAAGRPHGPAPFRGRFGFVLGALIGTGIAAAALVAVLVATAGDPPDGLARNWSSWQPASTEPGSGAAEIAEHVGHHYRIGSKQLVAITGGPIAIQSVPLSVALRPPGGDIEVLDGTGVLYTLNGLGPGGSIRDGKPSRARHLVLRREALELALYSFRYLEDVSMVVALLPPPPSDDAAAKGAKAGAKGANGTGKSSGQASKPDPAATQRQAIFYRPGDLRPQLEVPLGATMSADAPTPEAYKGAEARRIDTLTLSNLFLFSFQQAQDTKAYLVLDRPS